MPVQAEKSLLRQYNLCVMKAVCCQVALSDVQW